MRRFHSKRLLRIALAGKGGKDDANTKIENNRAFFLYAYKIQQPVCTTILTDFYSCCFRDALCDRVLCCDPSCCFGLNFCCGCCQSCYWSHFYYCCYCWKKKRRRSETGLCVYPLSQGCDRVLVHCLCYHDSRFFGGCGAVQGLDSGCDRAYPLSPKRHPWKGW